MALSAAGPASSHGAAVDHPKIYELRELSLRSAGQVWTSAERHGAMSGVMKEQID
jgi:arsenic resistance protein ArsH